MKQGHWTTKLGMAFLGLGLLVGCSGSGDNGQDLANLTEAAPAVNADQLVADWGKFAGLSPDEAKGALDAAGLLEKVGQVKNLSKAEFEAYVTLVASQDRIFTDGVDFLNRLNGLVARLMGNTIRRAIDGGLTTAPDTEGIEARRAAYADMVSQATLVRQRLVQGAALLGFVLEPQSMRDVVADPAFRGARDLFASDIIDEILDEPFKATSQDNIVFIAEALASVSFRIDGEYLSFYEFAKVEKLATDEEDAGRRFGGPRVTLGRGALSVLPAVDNFFTVVDELGQVPVIPVTPATPVAPAIPETPAVNP